MNKPPQPFEWLVWHSVEKTRTIKRVWWNKRVRQARCGWVDGLPLRRLHNHAAWRCTDVLLRLGWWVSSIAWPHVKPAENGSQADRPSTDPFGWSGRTTAFKSQVSWEDWITKTLIVQLELISYCEYEVVLMFKYLHFDMVLMVQLDLDSCSIFIFKVMYLKIKTIINIVQWFQYVVLV